MASAAKKTTQFSSTISSQLKRLLIGQDEVVDTIVPYVQLYKSGLSPEGRPVGVFFLAGPTGTGKTYTVQTLAKIIHGNPKNVLRIDCGEFQLEHEVAKLVGAPPGYLGHRETTPLINQNKLNAVTSERSSLSIVLFDEIEKAAVSLQRILLGIFDQASLKLCDNTTVNFERSLIFMTSNIGADEMQKKIRGAYGFNKSSDESIMNCCHAAIRKNFSPEFINRIDHTISYKPLNRKDTEKILDLEFDNLQTHLRSRLGPLAFNISLDASAKNTILKLGTSPEYGARELKRIIHRDILQQISNKLVDTGIPPASTVKVKAKAETVYLEVDN